MFVLANVICSTLLLLKLSTFTVAFINFFMSLIVPDDLKVMFQVDDDQDYEQFTRKDIYNLFNLDLMSAMDNWRNDDPEQRIGSNPSKNQLRNIFNEVFTHMEEQQSHLSYNQHTKYSTEIIRMLKGFVGANNPKAIYNNMRNYAEELAAQPEQQNEQHNNLDFSSNMELMFGGVEQFYRSNFFDSFAEQVSFNICLKKFLFTNKLFHIHLLC